MKVLITTTPGAGHVLPVLPLAREVRARRHDVRWVVGEAGTASVRAAGIETVTAGLSEAQRHAEFLRRHPDVMTLPERERRMLAFSTNFGELAAPPMLEALTPLVDRWTPDVLVHEAAELAGPLAAAAAGVPSVCHGFGEVVPEAAVRRAAETLAPRWEAAGLVPDPYAGCYQHLYLDIYPPSLRGMDMSHIPHVQPLQPAAGRQAAGALVYVTFGTMFNEVDDGFRAVVRAAAAAAAEVLVTVGAEGDPAAVGEPPPNVRVERYVPQAEVLPRCAGVICHGGSGTVLAAMAHGVPVLCLPRAADQFANAANIARAGAGLTLGPPDATEPAIRDALAELLSSSRVQQAARDVAAEIATMPDVTAAATAVEALSR